MRSIVASVRGGTTHPVFIVQVTDGRLDPRFVRVQSIPENRRVEPLRGRVQKKVFDRLQEKSVSDSMTFVRFETPFLWVWVGWRGTTSV